MVVVAAAVVVVVMSLGGCVGVGVDGGGRWWWWSCAAAAYVRACVRSDHVHPNPPSPSTQEDIPNWILFAQASRELDIPFIASGGCATGSQLAAALALGAEGMNMGTRFMATKEAPILDGIKKVT
jgi:hypothetical protein